MIVCQWQSQDAAYMNLRLMLRKSNTQQHAVQIYFWKERSSLPRNERRCVASSRAQKVLGDRQEVLASTKWKHHSFIGQVWEGLTGCHVYNV